MHTNTIGYAANSQFSEGAKLLEIQVVTREAISGDKNDAGFAKSFGAWCLICPPRAPDVDPLGQVRAAAEYACLNLGGDENNPVASRDARVSKYAQDVKGGEVALTNFFGSRLYLGEKHVAINAGGGFFHFDITAKTVGLTGIPAIAGGPAPYLTIDTSQIGLVSSSGGASVNVSDGQVTISGSSVSIDGGGVNLGVGASDPVVLFSLQTANNIVLQAWLNTHIHLDKTGAPPPILTGPPAVPLVLSPLIGSFRVKAGM